MSERTPRRVVITGLGVVSPIGVGVSAFERGLAEGRPGIGPIRSFDAGAFPTRIAGEVGDFDAAALRLPHAWEAGLRRDPKQLYALAAGREALHAAFGPAGCPTDDLPPERCGVFLASGLEIFHLEDLVPHLLAQGVDGAALAAALDAAPRAGLLQIPADWAARTLASQLRAAGPFLLDVSACAAGSQAVGEAYLAIREGAADRALCGGYDSMVNPLGLGGFCLLRAMSTSNELGGAACRPFDLRRDGFVMGEGAAALVLEELELARARGAPVLGELLGYCSTLDAFQVTAPAEDQSGAIAVMQGALADAGLAPRAIDYINAHGTGTFLNDRAESAAIREVFGDPRQGPPVSSTKSQIGHTIGAAGALELGACLFALRHSLLPATISLAEVDPDCALDHVAGRPRPQRCRRVLSNSFGFGGQNACLILGEAPRGPGGSRQGAP